MSELMSNTYKDEEVERHMNSRKSEILSGLMYVLS